GGQRQFVLGIQLCHRNRVRIAHEAVSVSWIFLLTIIPTHQKMKWQLEWRSCRWQPTDRPIRPASLKKTFCFPWQSLRPHGFLQGYSTSRCNREVQAKEPIQLDVILVCRKRAFDPH